MHRNRIVQNLQKIDGWVTQGQWKNENTTEQDRYKLSYEFHCFNLYFFMRYSCIFVHAAFQHPLLFNSSIPFIMRIPQNVCSISTGYQLQGIRGRVPQHFCLGYTHWENPSFNPLSSRQDIHEWLFSGLKNKNASKSLMAVGYPGLWENLHGKCIQILLTH